MRQLVTVPAGISSDGETLSLFGTDSMNQVSKKLRTILTTGRIQIFSSTFRPAAASGLHLFLTLGSYDDITGVIEFVLAPELDQELDQLADRMRLNALIRLQPEDVDTIILVTGSPEAARRYPEYYERSQIGLRPGVKPVDRLKPGQAVVLEVASASRRVI